MRADRLLQVMYLLRRHGRMTAADLAGRLEVSERTILRDLDALSTAGVPVWAARGRGGGWQLMEGYRTDVSGLSPTEAQALFAWTSQSATSELGLGGELATALTKLAATVPQQALAQADALASVIAVDRRRWFNGVDEVPLLPVLRDAAVRRRRLRLRYRSVSAPAARQRTVDPYGVVENAGRWYLLAAHRGEVRSYRVSRVEHAQVLDERARLPERLDLAEEWERVRNRFESGARPVTLELAVRQEMEDEVRMVLTTQLVGGSAIEALPGTEEGWVGLRATVRAPRQGVALVLGFGGDVRLLKPDGMRAELVARARAALAVHQTGEPG